MSKIRLGVNIDHVATIRNARGERYPDPLRAAKAAIDYGADSVTVHLREDRRHINDNDLKKIIKLKRIPVNLEIAPTLEMTRIALRNPPNFICIVPEKREEITTEGGLNLKRNKKHLSKMISLLKKKKIRVSVFIEPKIQDIKLAKDLDADCIEIHTGKICRLINKKRNYSSEIKKINKAIMFANSINLETHAGHGLTFASAKVLKNLKGIKEFNIGHFIVSESVFYGLEKVIKRFKRIIGS